MSSVYCVILCLNDQGGTSYTFGLDPIAVDIISTAKSNSNWDRGHPCHTSLYILIFLV